jgi:cell division protease FtsH
MARKMVTQYGMSRLGPIIYGEPNREVFLGRDYGHVRNYSEKMASEIDAEVEKLAKSAYNNAKSILKKHEPLLHSISKELLAKETLSQKDFLQLVPKSSWKESEVKVALQEEKVAKKRAKKKLSSPKK